ncbi:MAG: 2OG-Fe dioxygenase family protein [Alphaproteobacteria bacterium]|nr:2OG-Fe dioxygenase family protein [Alphaproteobacteria bacterium]MBV9552854.1 2OG-Fe dioxygenase family protein [Alphaproteobacteria bacterium]
MEMIEPLADVARRVAGDGFAFVAASDMRAVLQQAGLRDWDTFAQSWNDLGVDTYMADGGRYRRRRFAVFRATAEDIARKPHQPHYQSRDYNPLNGDVERWFEPVTHAIGAHPSLRAILDTCYRLFHGLTPAKTRPASWHVEIHQFRIEANATEAGQPTPEGMHRDGVDWVLVLLVERVNIERGETTIADQRRHPLGSFTLADPLDAAVTDDNRVYHGVTPVTPLDRGRPGHRDVLVVTFRRE